MLVLLLLAFQDPGALIDRLRSERIEEREDAARQLREIGRPALDELGKARRDPDPEVAGRAGHLIRQIQGTAEFSPALLKAFPGIEKELGNGNDHDWTLAFLKAIRGSLTPEDVAPLAAGAVRGAATNEEKHNVCMAVRDLGLRPALRPVVDLLKDRDEEVRRTASIALRQMAARETIPEVCALLRHPDGKVRLIAVDLLPGLGAKESIPQITRLLADREGGVRGIAAGALARLEGPAAVPKLLMVLKLDPAPWVRLQAARALAELRPGESAPAILGLLRDPDASVRLGALELLDPRSCRDACPELARLLADPSADIRQKAVGFLEFLNSPEGRPDMIRLLHDGDAGVRGKAAAALGSMRVKSAAPELLPLLEDGDAGVRGSAAVALGLLAARDAIPRLIRLLDDPEPEVRGHGLSAIALLDAREAVPALTRLLNSEKVVRLRGRLCMTLADLDGKAALPALLGLASGGEPEVIRALGRLGAREAIPQIRKLLQRQDNDVRTAAIEALGVLQAAESAPDLVRLLHHPGDDFCTCHPALWALANMDTPESLPSILSMLGNTDENHFGLVAAVLGYLNAREAVPLLTDRLKDEGELALLAGLALGELGTADAAPVLVENLRWGGTRGSRAAEALVHLGAKDQIPAMVRLLERVDSVEKGGVAAALCQMGSKEGVALLLRPNRQLSALNALRRAEVWSELRRKQISSRPPRMTIEALLRQLEGKDLRIEGSGDREVCSALEARLSWYGPARISGLEALSNLEFQSAEWILETDRIRIVTREEAERFWHAWWDAEQQRK